jgi:hypothetical protein
VRGSTFWRATHVHVAENVSGLELDLDSATPAVVPVKADKSQVVVDIAAGGSVSRALLCKGLVGDGDVPRAE